ncbi:hypothetical protein NUACC21_51960 [Scytonema sp. NUACC21]
MTNSEKLMEDGSIDWLEVTTVYIILLGITMIETTRCFTPDWVSPPGDTIADLLEERDWTQALLAQLLGYTTKYISLLINGKEPINEEAALKLERVLGSTAVFWLNREAQYRAYLVGLEEENPL